jgi:hypothetical protein
MDSLLQFAPIQRQLFKDVSEPKRLGNSCVISFGRPRRRGRFLVPTTIAIGTALLLFLSFSGLAGI